MPILAFDQDGNKLIEGTAASIGKGYFPTVKHVVTRVSDQGKRATASAHGAATAPPAGRAWPWRRRAGVRAATSVQS